MSQIVSEKYYLLETLYNKEKTNLIAKKINGKYYIIGIFDLDSNIPRFFDPSISPVISNITITSVTELTLEEIMAFIL